MDEPRASRTAARSHELVRSPEFRRLVARRWTVALGLLALLSVAYFGFVLLVAFAPVLLARPFAGALTLGVALSIAVIGAAYLLTAGYVSWANGAHDREVSALRSRWRG